MTQQFLDGYSRKHFHTLNTHLKFWGKNKSYTAYIVHNDDAFQLSFECKHKWMDAKDTLTKVLGMHYIYNPEGRNKRINEETFARTFNETEID